MRSRRRREIDWTDGVVMAMNSKGQLLITQRKFADAEKQLTTSAEVCEQAPSCSGLDISYRWLGFVFVYHLRSHEKVRELVDRVFVHQSRLAEEDTANTLINEFAAGLRAQGFEAEAKEIESRIHSRK